MPLPGLLTFTALLIDTASKTPPHALMRRLLHRVLTIGKDADRWMKSLPRCYEDDHDRKFCNVLLSFTTAHYIYFNQPPMTTSVADAMANESYSMLMPPRTGMFWINELSLTTNATDKDGFSNSVSFDRAIPLPSAKFAKKHLIYAGKEPVDEEYDRVDEGGGKLQQTKLLRPSANKKSIALCLMWAEAITFKTSCPCYATHQHTIRLSRLNTFHNTSSLAIGMEWGVMWQGEKDVDKHTSTEEGK